MREREGEQREWERKRDRCIYILPCVVLRWSTKPTRSTCP